MQGTAADEPFVEHARPDADPVGRGLEQPRHRRRGHLARRGRAVATAAVARPDDGVLVSLDVDLEESGAALAVGGIGLAAARTHARILRRIACFLLLSEPGALGAPVSGGAALLAALAPGARLLLPLAPAAVECLGQDAPGSNAACRGRVPASRHARPAPRSRPSDPAPRRAARHFSSAATRSARLPARPPHAAGRCARAATRSCPPGPPPNAGPPRAAGRIACAATRPRARPCGTPSRSASALGRYPASAS